jgi:predicted dehydrogenase
VKKLRIAVIGAGHMGRLHAAKFAARADAELVAVADPDLARAEGLANDHRCVAFADYKKLLESAKPDAVVIAAPTDRHHEIGLACLQHGKHALIEKPIARTLPEADELIALARARGVALQAGHVERHNRAFRALVARMDRPLFIDAERLSGFKQRGAEVDVVLDLMIHDLDLAVTLAKSNVADVSAAGFRVLTRDIDIANARIEFDNGCVANLSASRVSQAPLRKLRVFQPDLYVSADLQAGKLRYVKQAAGTIEESEETHPGGDALADQAADFVSSVLNGRQSMVSGEEGRKALQLALEVGRLVRERLERFG